MPNASNAPLIILIICGLILIFIFVYYFNKLRAKPTKFNRYKIVVRDKDEVTIFSETILAENYYEARDFAKEQTPKGGSWIVVKI